MVEELFSKPIIIFGCGNILFGDDGFGPEVVGYLQGHYQVPDHVAVADVGTGIGDFLFDFLLISPRPTHIFIVDSISRPQRYPGEIFEVNLDDLPKSKVSGFSLHQFPAVNLLRELQQFGGVVVRILAVQVKDIPDAVLPGLSHEVQTAIPHACEWLIDEIKRFVSPRTQTGPEGCHTKMQSSPNSSLDSKGLR